MRSPGAGSFSSQNQLICAEVCFTIGIFLLLFIIPLFLVLGAKKRGVSCCTMRPPDPKYHLDLRWQPSDGLGPKLVDERLRELEK